MFPATDFNADDEKKFTLMDTAFVEICLFREIAIAIDEEKFIASGGNCHLNSSVEFQFPCPVECSGGACVLNIKLPEVSFMELLTVKVNDTHEIVYVHENEGAHSVLRYTAKRGPENMVLYTCVYKEKENFDQVTYRLFWPGSDRFVGQNEALTSSSNEVELEWIVNYWGPHNYRRFECYADDQLLCSGLTTTSEEGMCNVNDYGEIYVFTLTAWRKQNTAMARYVCRAAAASQERTIFWKDQIRNHVKEHIPG
ncbi:hypothetical protein SprV_0200606700 [Sparganum proliferum]